MTVLLDSNVLIALVVGDHVHHEAASAWFARSDGGFATCPVTEGSLLRLLVRESQPVGAAVDVLRQAPGSDRQEFWPDHLSHVDVPVTGVIGHRQVTDAYLAELSRAHGGRLATFDEGLAALHPDVVELVPTI